MKTFTAALVASLLASPLLAQGWIEPVPGTDPAFGVIKVRTAVGSGRATTSIRSPARQCSATSPCSRATWSCGGRR